MGVGDPLRSHFGSSPKLCRLKGRQRPPAPLHSATGSRCHGGLLMQEHLDLQAKHQGVLCFVGTPTEVTQSLRRLGVWLGANPGNPAGSQAHNGGSHACQQCGFDLFPFQPEGQGTGDGNHAPCSQPHAKAQSIQLPFPLPESVHSQRVQSSGRGNAAPIGLGLCHGPPQGKGKGNSGNDRRIRAGPDEGQDGRCVQEGCQGQCKGCRTCSSRAPQSFQIFDEDEARQEVTNPFQESGNVFTGPHWEEWQMPHPAWEARQQPHPSGQDQKPFQGHGKGFAQQYWEEWQQPHPSWQSEHEFPQSFQGYGEGFTQPTWEARPQPHPTCRYQQQPPWEARQEPHPQWQAQQAHQGKEPFPEPEGQACQNLSGWWAQPAGHAQCRQAPRWRPVHEASQPDRLQRKITEFFRPATPPPIASTHCDHTSGDLPPGSDDPGVVALQEQACQQEQAQQEQVRPDGPTRARSWSGPRGKPIPGHEKGFPRSASQPPAWYRPGMGQMGLATEQMVGGPQQVPKLAKQAFAQTTTPSSDQRQGSKEFEAGSEWDTPRSKGNVSEWQAQGPELQLQGKGQGQEPTAPSQTPSPEPTQAACQEAESSPSSPECPGQVAEGGKSKRRGKRRKGRGRSPLAEPPTEESEPPIGDGARLLGGRPVLGTAKGRCRVGGSGNDAPTDTTGTSGDCCGHARSSPMRDTVSPTEAHGRPPDLASKVLHLRCLKARVLAKQQGGTDLLGTIDQILDLPDICAGSLPVLCSHVDRCTVFAEKWLSS